MAQINRRKAIKRLLLLGGGAAATYGGFKTYKILKTPDLSVLDKHQTVIDDLAEVIIPATDTPGAKEAQVGKFISKMVREATKKQSQNQFVEGLADLVDYSNKNFGKPFNNCSGNEKIRILQHFESKGKPYSGFLGKVEKRLVGDSFFTTLKKYTVIGYCTSLEGASMALAYDYIPGEYKAIIKMKPGQKAWALQ